MKLLGNAQTISHKKKRKKGESRSAAKNKQFFTSLEEIGDEASDYEVEALSNTGNVRSKVF